RSRKEVARQLAISEGTLSSRLAAARKKLAARLARYGLAFSGASLAALLAENTASASVPAALSGATVKAAMLVAVGPAAIGLVSTTVTTLTEGVLKAMFVAKIKTATVVLFGVAALGVGTGGVVYQTRVGAADPQQRDRTVQGLSRPTTETDQEKDKLRQIAEEDQARERELRDQLKQLNQEVEKLRKHMAVQQQEEARLLEYIKTQKEAQIAARKREEKGLAEKYDPSLRREGEKKADRSQLDSNKALLDELDAKRKSLLAEYEKRLQALAAEQKQLEEKMRMEVAELDKMKTE